MRHLQPTLDLVAVYCAIFAAFVFAASLLSGWRGLAERFRAHADFPNVIAHWAKARLRYGTNYGMKVGADYQALWIVPALWPRFFHPPLCIPWREITVEKSSALNFYLSVTLKLGSTEKISFRITKRTATKIRDAAGPSWPDSANTLNL